MDRAPRRVQRTRIAVRLRPREDGPKPRYCGRPGPFGNPFKVGTRRALARVPAADMVTPWEYEDGEVRGTIPRDGFRYHAMVWPGGDVTAHHLRYMTREESVATHRRALIAPTEALHLSHRTANGPAVRVTVDLVRFELAGQNLSCWCHLDNACHVDTLLWVANAPLDEIKMAIEDEYAAIREMAERVAQLHPEVVYAVS